MHALVPGGIFRFLLLGHIGLLDGDDARRLRRAAGDIGIERDQHAIAHRQAAEIERLGLGQILFPGAMRLRIAVVGTWTWCTSPASVFTVSVSPLMAVMLPR